MIAGSHNWTTAAEEDNDENTLIIHDATIANLYLQEFSLRWCEVKNNSNCTLPFTTSSQIINDTQQELILFPNPIKNEATIRFEHSCPSKLVAKLFNTSGQLIDQFEYDSHQKEYYLDFSSINTGLYFLIIKNDKNTWQYSITINK